MKLKQYSVVVRLDVASLDERPNLAVALSGAMQQLLTPWARANDCLISDAVVSVTEQSPKAHDVNDSFEREEAAQARVREFMRNH